MPKKKSICINEMVEAISLTKRASTEWPAGFANRLVRELIQRGEREFQDGLFKIMETMEKKPQRGK